MTARKSTGKRARFEVFKRDNFTCQYCGAQPPDAVLVVDHMTPVALGGTNELINLITSCEPCNQGKAAKPLGQIHPRPDADLMYLEVQQEIAELQRFQRSTELKRAALDAAIVAIQDEFSAVAGSDWHPSAELLEKMIVKYDPEIVLKSAVILACRADKLRASNWVQYLWGICRNINKTENPESNITWADLTKQEQETIGRLVVADVLSCDRPSLCGVGQIFDSANDQWKAEFLSMMKFEMNNPEGESEIAA